MKIALFGATGMIGRRIASEALRRGHSILAVARNPSRLSEQDPHLHPTPGNVLDPQAVAAIVTGQDAVVSAFAPVEQPPHTLVESARSLIAGLSAAGVRRLIVVGGAGSLEVAPGRALVDTPEFPAAWKELALAHRDALNVLRDEGNPLEWTYLSPPSLIEPGERTGQFRRGADQVLTDAQGQSRISAEDYAIALIDELETPAHIRRRFTVAY